MFRQKLDSCIYYMSGPFADDERFTGRFFILQPSLIPLINKWFLLPHLNRMLHVNNENARDRPCATCACVGLSSLAARKTVSMMKNIALDSKFRPFKWPGSQMPSTPSNCKVLLSHSWPCYKQLLIPLKYIKMNIIIHPMKPSTPLAPSPEY